MKKKKRKNILPMFAFIFFILGMLLELLQGIFSILWQRIIVLSIVMILYLLFLIWFNDEIDMFEKDIKKRSKKK